MKDIIYLIFDRSGIVHMRKSLPNLSAGQYAVKLEVFIDNKYFERIVPTATMSLDDSFLIKPKIYLEPQVVSKEELEDEVEIKDLPVTEVDS